MNAVVSGCAPAFIDAVFESQRESARRFRYSTHRERTERLQALHDGIVKNQSRIEGALYADLRKCPEEARINELIPSLIELRFARKHLRKWMKPVRVSRTFPLLLGRGRIQYEPRGRVLIISSWNYPILLTMAPLVAAIAAGNTAIIKPSELSPNASHVIKEIISATFHSSEYAVIEGGVETVQYLLRKPFDHIFFTGSAEKGVQVMKAAAEHLASVTLELGGKSPAIIDETADIPDAAMKIAWGKYLNAGQTCIAPDYVFVPRVRENELIDSLQKSFAQLAGDNGQPSTQASIVTDTHYEKIRGLYEDALAHGARVAFGGNFNDDNRCIGPTVLTNVDRNSDIMKSEIFGPLLPVIPYDNLEEVIEFVNAHGKPLALYVFGRKKKRQEYITRSISAGGTCINNLLIHHSHPGLPFGGVNQSGMGRYHGYHGFKELSHERAVFIAPRFNFTRVLYPPYTKVKRHLLSISVKFFSR